MKATMYLYAWMDDDETVSFCASSTSGMASEGWILLDQFTHEFTLPDPAEVRGRLLQQKADELREKLEGMQKAASILEDQLDALKAKA